MQEQIVEGLGLEEREFKLRVIKPKVEVTFWTPERGTLEHHPTIEDAIEKAARVCYKSENRIKQGSAGKMVKRLRENGHHAMLEFGYIQAHIIGDRGLTHELVTHRLISKAQESTRYCNYSKDKFDKEITVVEQPGIEGRARGLWDKAMKASERYYFGLLGAGVPPQLARSVLPIGLKAEIVIGTNPREWRHIFKMRCAKTAHPIIRGVMLEVLRKFVERMPAIYGDQAEEFLEDTDANY